MDFARGLAIISVVLLHVVDEYFSKVELTEPQWTLYQGIRIIGRLGVPVFLMLSGALILSSVSNTPILHFYKKRLPQFIALTTFYFFITNLFCSLLFNLPFSFKEYFYSLIAFKPTFAYQLWYMYIIIILYILAPLIGRALSIMSNRNIIIAFALYVTTIALSKMLSPSEFGSLWSKYSSYMAYFVFGYLVFNRGVTDKISIRLAFFALIFSFSFTLFVQVYLKEIGAFHGEGMTWYSSPFILITSMALFTVISKIKINEYVYLILKPVSLNSFGIYLF
ncbi:acyltransferase family protein, partial [Serratia marcescens]|uniref:acyltransferase family protein n=1 Tax=Serratia marcescens TaxID=615 RepID=UPI0013DAC255